ncbi:MAG: low molecular weight phosphotyrosine protein phosphatase [Gemmatimonadota bacterium]
MSGREGERGSEPRRILFVCTGNTCRSPLAEGLARAAAARLGREVEIRSAGILAMNGAPASRWAEVVADERGVDLSAHRSRPLDGDLLSWADLVVGMAASHLEAAREIDPGARLTLATEFLPADHPEKGRDVPDPVGLGRDAYAWTRDLLSACVDGLLDADGDVGREPEERSE